VDYLLLPQLVVVRMEQRPQYGQQQTPALQAHMDASARQEQERVTHYAKANTTYNGQEMAAPHKQPGLLHPRLIP
jgi:hypothetical protein